MDHLFPFKNQSGKSILAKCVLVLFIYVFGAYSYQNYIFPIGLYVSVKNYLYDLANPKIGQYDEFLRLVHIAGKQEMPCPEQDDTTAVLLVIGQSNSANHAEKKITTRHRQNVFNYFNGTCFVAASPLLGGTGEGGEFLTPLADELIDRGTYKNVVIIASGIGGSPIARWQVGGDLNQMLLDTVKPIKNYKITDIIWHQGETDFGISLNTGMYVTSFLSLKDSLRNAGVTAPFFIAAATKCGDNPYWKPVNPITIAQKQLDDKRHIILATNTDELLNVRDRHPDLCHFSESGQYKVAKAYAEVIFHYHKK